MNILIYNEEGRILRSVDCPADQAEGQVEEGEFYRRGVADDEKHYILDGRIVLRPTIECVLDTSRIETLTGVATLSGLPVPCTLYIDREAYPITEDFVEITLDQVKRYQLRVTDCFPYLDKELTIDAY